MRKFLLAFIVCISTFMTSVSICCAEEIFVTGYRLIIEDGADLLSETEEDELATIMREITTYGNVAFLSTDVNLSTAENYAKNRYKALFGQDSGTVFLIDMDNRMIWIYSDGAMYKVITTAYANTITDNVYQYASDADYYECAAEAYRQIIALLEGQRIAQPMKYISNALLSMLLSMLILFGLACYFTRLKKPSEDEILAHVEKQFISSNPTATFKYETKRYDPVSSDSGGGGSSGGGSSGGSSGGGGGHSF